MQAPEKVAILAVSIESANFCKLSSFWILLLWLADKIPRRLYIYICGGPAPTPPTKNRNISQKMKSQKCVQLSSCPANFRLVLNADKVIQLYVLTSVK